MSFPLQQTQELIGSLGLRASGSPTSTPNCWRARIPSDRGGIIGSEVRTSSRFLEVVLLSQKRSEELLGVGGELLNGLVLIEGELCGNKELFSWSLQEDAHGGTCNTIVGLEVFPPILLELTRCIEKAQTWPYFVELSFHQSLALPLLQPFLCAIAALQHFGWLLYCDLRVEEGALRP